MELPGSCPVGSRQPRSAPKLQCLEFPVGLHRICTMDLIAGHVTEVSKAHPGSQSASATLYLPTLHVLTVLQGVNPGSTVWNTQKCFCPLET